MFHSLIKLFVKVACVFLQLVKCYCLASAMLTSGFIFVCKGEFDKQKAELLCACCIEVAGVMLFSHISEGFNIPKPAHCHLQPL